MIREQACLYWTLETMSPAPLKTQWYHQDYSMNQRLVGRNATSPSLSHQLIMQTWASTPPNHDYWFSFKGRRVPLRHHFRSPRKFARTVKGKTS
ncbi:hypothetical protein Agabi119p4_8400 [Agaricus bisporus var. burnettii]|uniref:Uncharacterized protein n=1 Tax=Agaricus bisporus var. burnettii TaxID=192524 RepID=A0A8H7C5S2_AGABI|nr:hypothetical protein Agabi119p4_8400 [Agaricus bisporus var. burnettii]